VTSRTLRDGLAVPGGYRVRQARPEDSAAIARFMGMAGVPAETPLLEAIDSGLCGSVARRVVGGETDLATAMAELLYAYGPGPDLYHGLSACSTILVATHPDCAEPVGMCHATPPGPLLGRLDQAEDPAKAQMMVLMAVRRLSSLAVDPVHRGAGLGQTLLRLNTRLVFQLNAQLLYGHMRVEDKLAGWYRQAGLSVLSPGHGLSLAWLLDLAVRVMPGQGEQLFATRSTPGSPLPTVAPPVGPQGA
jgi:GNAT superfamily N-acetyltransferase